MSTVWVFGYGSLVDPASFGSTIGRELVAGEGRSEATLHGHGRRWNYGIGHSVGRWTDTAGIERIVTLVALGLVAGTDESANGVVVAVDDHELARLDHRERHYDRVDVTGDVVATGVDIPAPADRVVTYVPRRAAIDRYERARDAGTAAVERRYVDLVDAAFASLGPTQLDRFHRTTPAPDVPVLEVTRQSMN